MDENTLYQQLGVISESIEAFNHRLQRMESFVEKELRDQRRDIEMQLREQRFSIEVRMREHKKEIKEIKSLPGKFVWAVVIALAAAAGAVLSRLIGG
jgi:ElaB/YqjD/DUF883 family membrane-anchored ribosome-binding protein